jgi:hypothetical protein
MLNEVKKIGVSRCLYCQSTSYGKGCRYGPKGVHFHPDDAKKCSYCGSTNYGKGCKINPFNNIHMHGIDYNSMFNESITNKFLLHNLNKDYREFEAYKCGIIDDEGNKIKEPVTVQEKASFSPGIRSILKIKKYLGSKLDLMNHTLTLENKNNLNYNKENHKQILNYEEQINNIYKQLHEVTDNALRDGLTLEQVETILQ